MTAALRIEVRDWIANNWALDITVREWWRRLAEAGLTSPTWPAPYGRSASMADARAITEELAAAKTIAPPMGHVGMRLAGPTLLRHGDAALQERYLPPLLRGEEAWCQLFSEPGAGSDLPALSARAVRDGDTWFVSGQKVWNSAADTADLGMLLARTDPDAPKREGISFFAFEMDQPGVEVRPLRMMTGEAHFCEVFLDEARIAGSDLVGDVNRGWTVARTVLGLERSTATEVAARGLRVVPSGARSGQLDRVVGDVLADDAEAAKSYTVSALRSRHMIELARERGVNDDPVVRQQLARYFTLTEVHRWNQGRARAEARTGQRSAVGAVSKIALGRICNLSREVSFGMLGASALLAGADAPEGGELLLIGLSSPGVTIGAGTDEIQRNTIGEQVLGLPRDPAGDVDPNARPKPTI
jgi:alkylation response protein AidB-like acyl-CoA dehydrogenase